MGYTDSGLTHSKPADFEFRLLLVGEKPVLIPITLQVHENHHSHRGLYHEYSEENSNILYLINTNDF